MKKLIAIASAAAFLASAVPAFAFDFGCGGWMQPQCQEPEPVVSNVTVNTNNSGTNVSNNVVTVAKTGGNSLNGGLIFTGDAYAESSAQNNVNITDVGVAAPCDTCGGGDVKVSTTNSGTNVSNNVVTVAKTGGNSVTSMPSFQMPCWYQQQSNDSGMIFTGNAGALSSAVNFVNQTIVRVTR